MSIYRRIGALGLLGGLALAVFLTLSVRSREATSEPSINPSSPSLVNRSLVAPTAAGTPLLPPYPGVTQTPIGILPTRTLPSYPIPTVGQPLIPILTPRIALPTTTAQPPLPNPTSTLARPSAGPSFIQYTAVIESADPRTPSYAFYRLNLGSDLRPLEDLRSVQLPTSLDFVPFSAWPSPSNEHIVLMRPSEPGGIPYVVNTLTGTTRGATPRQNGGGRFFGWHPNSRQFLFWIDMSGLWLIDAETLNKVTLSNPHGPVQGAAISPDGATIAYVDDNLPASLHALWLVSSTGGDARPLFDDRGIGYMYPNAWSPDGRRIIYLGSCSPQASKNQPSPSKSEQTTSQGPICIVDVRTNLHQGVSLPYSEYEPNWSPDARYIVATGHSSSGTPESRCGKGYQMQSLSDQCIFARRSIYLADLETSQIQELTAGIAPVWSPDGSQIAFLSDRSGSPEVWTLDLATQHIQQMTTEGNAKVPYGQLLWYKELKK